MENELEDITGPKDYIVIGDNYFYDVIIRVSNKVLEENKWKKTKRMAERYVYNTYWIEPSSSPYDCTGQRFSRRIEIIHCDKIYRIITIRHWIGIDV